MKKLKHPLDYNNQYFIDFEYDEKTNIFKGGLRINLNSYHKDMRVEDSLNTMMKITVDNQEIKIGKRGVKEGYFNNFEFNVLPNTNPELKIILRDDEFGKYRLNPEKTRSFFGDNRSPNKLTAFEVRSLARADDVPYIPFSRKSLPKIHGRTDLHTHFAAIVPSNRILNAAFIKSGDDIIYPIANLDNLDIKYDKSKIIEGLFGKGIPLRKENFTKKDIIKLQEAMHIPVDKQATFSDLEEVYNYRLPITKTDDMFEPLAWLAAKTYKETGVRYAEATFTKMVDPSWVDRVNKVMPEIEKKYDLKIRFLAGIIRFDAEPINMYKLDKIKVLAKSPYIVGVDYIGHETNATKDFEYQLEYIAKWAKQYHPNFIIRVHAGESSLHTNNIKDALKVAKKYGVKMRIGHGLYGVDDETVNLFKETKAIVEFNMHSNLALNNIDSVEQLPITRYLNEGVRVVLASDGGGIYQANAVQEALVARFAGVTNRGMKAIRDTEREYIKMQKENLARKEARNDAFIVEYNKIPKAEPYFQASELLLEQRLQEEKKQHKLLMKNIRFDAQIREVLFKGKHPIFVSGSGTSLDDLEDNDKRQIYIALDILMEFLDNKKIYFITSGYKYGVEGLFHQLKKIKHKAPKILAVIAQNTFFHNTDYTAVDAGVFLGKTRHDRCWHEIQYLNQTRGSAVFFGGGSITSDQIQSSVNYDLDYYLMTAAGGSSASKAIYDKKHSCNCVQELIKLFYKNNQNLFREDFNLEYIPYYIMSSENKVSRILKFNKMIMKGEK